MTVGGVSAIDTRSGGVTVSAAPGEFTAFRVAVITDCPTATPVATPAPLIVALAVLEEIHVTADVRFCVV